MIKLTNFIWSESVVFPKNKNVLRRLAAGQVSSSVESPWALPWVGPRGSSCGEIRCLARGLGGVNKIHVLNSSPKRRSCTILYWYHSIFIYVCIHSMDMLSGCCKTRQLDSRNIVKPCRFVAAMSLAWCSTAEPSGLWIAWDCHWRRR